MVRTLKRHAQERGDERRGLSPPADPPGQARRLVERFNQQSKALIILALLLASPGWGGVRGQSSLPKPLQKVGFDQRLNEQVPLDLVFRDEAGGTIRLGDLFRGKPVILVLAYYRCPKLCNEVLNGLTQAMLELPFVAGREFNVVTVSFDPRETPALAAAKKRTYLERYGHPEAEAGWRFLTGEQDPIDRLTKAVGFRYTYDERNDLFAHASGIMVLTPRGKISKYFFDVRFNPRDLRLGLVEASDNRIGSPVDQILLFCFHYDPITGKYGPAVMKLVRLGGVLTMLGIAALVFFMSRRNRRAARRREREQAEAHPEPKAGALEG